MSQENQLEENKAERNKAGNEDQDAWTPSPGMPEPPRSAMDAACLGMANANLAVKNRCDAFEALLVMPSRDLGAIRLAAAAARMAGIKAIGLTTSYLTELHRYMKALEEAA